MRSLFGAVAFLTVLPVPKKYKMQDPSEAAVFFPVVGALLGAILTGADYLLSYTTLTPFTESTLIVALLLILTGMLHIDGLADTTDAFFAPHRTKEERLRILKDTQVGVFGVVAVLLTTILKVDLIGALQTPQRRMILLLFPVISRTSILLPSLILPYARKEGGTARSFVNGVKPLTVVMAVLICAVLGVVCMRLDGLIMMATAFSTSFFVSVICYRRFGGVTGDVLGASLELSELPILIHASNF